MTSENALVRRDLLTTGGAGAAALVLAGLVGGHPSPALAAGNFGPRKKLVFVPQAAGDWNIPIRAGQRDFCAMVGWDYQFLGNPVYSVENHAEQVNNAIAAKADVIITELENAGMTPTFKQAMSRGIVMVVIDQGVVKECDSLGLGIIGEDPLVSGYNNGWQGASFAQKLTGKKEGVLIFGNGNPGADLIDNRQKGSEQGILAYNKANGTKFTFTAFPDSSFDDENQSIQKYGAQIDEAGDALVGVITGGNIVPGVKALQERGFKPGQVSAGSTDLPPAQQQLMDQGWVQWGTDQQQYMMGIYSAQSAFLVLDGYRYPTIRTGEGPLLKADLERVKKRTAIWEAKARAYGDIK
jgi:ABC-type sugar transport system substrate-binding protein